MTRVKSTKYNTVSENVRYIPPEFGREPETVADVLEAAACVLDEEGRWTQGTWFTHENVKHPEYNENPFCNGWNACADGAMQVVTLGLFRYLGPADDPEPDPQPVCHWTTAGSHYSDTPEVGPMWALYSDAVNRLTDTLRRETGRPAWEPCGIVGFNDGLGRTRTEVVEMMRLAAADARADDSKTHAACTAPPVPA